MAKAFFLAVHMGLTVAASQAQTPFRIDSTALEGVTLNKGWTRHTGDYPDWAKPSIDDSKWGSIDPSQDIDNLPQIK